MKNEQKTHYFLKARYLIIWDGHSHRQMENGYLEVKGNEIAGIYSVLPDGAEAEDLGNVAIVPGFLNLHCHPSEVCGGRSYNGRLWKSVFL